VEADLRGPTTDTWAQEARAARRRLDAGTDVVLRDLADLFRKGERDTFASHGAALGKTWAPLAASTQKARARLAAKFGLPIQPAAPVLVNYGDLRDAMTVKGGAHHQQTGQYTVTIDVNPSAVNRHDRKKGLGMALTKNGQRRRKARGKGGRYPEDILAIHNDGAGKAPRREFIGVPGYIDFMMSGRVARWLDNVAALLGEPDGSGGLGGDWTGWHD
jgi:hypothetical protein